MDLGDGCSARCDEDYTDTGRSCVILIAQQANYLEALLDCQNRGAVLAAINTQEEQDIIHSLTGMARYSSKKSLSFPTSG